MKGNKEAIKIITKNGLKLNLEDLRAAYFSNIDQMGMFYLDAMAQKTMFLFLTKF